MRTRLLLALLGSLSLALPGLAQDEAAEAPVVPAENPPPAPADPNSEQAEDEDEDDESTDIDEFIFSEEIPADEQLVFPVDI